MLRLMTGQPHAGLVSRVVCHTTICIPMRFQNRRMPTACLRRDSNP